MSAREEVEVNVEYGLARPAPVVDDHPVALCVETFFIGDLLGCKKEMADKLTVSFGHAVNFGDMFLGYDEGMDGGLGVRVLEGDHHFVLKDDLGRDFFIDDLAKDAIGVAAHDFFPSPESEKLRKKQLRAPVWQAGPV